MREIEWRVSDLCIMENRGTDMGGRHIEAGIYGWKKVRVGGKERVNRKGVYPSGRRKE